MSRHPPLNLPSHVYNCHSEDCQDERANSLSPQQDLFIYFFGFLFQYAIPRFWFVVGCFGVKFATAL